MMGGAGRRWALSSVMLSPPSYSVTRLYRWAGKQRADGRRGEMGAARRERLALLGFEFEEDEAEFQVWVPFGGDWRSFGAGGGVVEEQQDEAESRVSV